MEVEAAPVATPSDATNRRRSGRTVHKPVLFQQDPNVSILPNGSAKRKRGERAAPHDADDADGADSLSDPAETEPTPEEIKEKRRRVTKTPKAKEQGDKPAAKRKRAAKDDELKLAMRPATNGVKKPVKPRRPAARKHLPQDLGSDLYGAVFGNEKAPEEVAMEWIEKYNEHNANAMCDLVNSVFRCAGCDLKVDIHNIEDPDNATSKISDIQDEFGAQKISDYPLISRAKGNAFSRPAFQSFWQSLIETAHATGVLYSDEALMENIQVWVATMSSSSLRPFRHTATVASLAMQLAMCNNYRELTSNNAAAVRQKATEEKKRTANKGRVATLKKKVDEGERRRQAAENILRDIFDTVFVHRYRDVEPKIRTDCVAALGAWIAACPDVFFEGTYIRYLGWILSDTAAAPRAEVVKQLLRLYKTPENVGRLRAFTDRFRHRMVEMGTNDADAGVRALTVELLELVRSLGLLHMEDIDVIGKLVFDAEPRVRKAVAPFFAANVEDTLEVVLEELGGAEMLDETLGAEPDDPESPRKMWLKIKCIAEVLDAYDDEANEGSSAPIPGLDNLLVVGDLESRYSLAANVVCEGIEEARDYEAVSGFLLYDMSETSRTSTEDPIDAIKKRCQTTEKEERLLLEVLLAAIKIRLANAAELETDKRGRRTKTKKDESREVQEAIAVHLAKVIPFLLRKYGASPATASVVLRLQGVLDLDLFQELRQDTTEYTALLEGINKQFSEHKDRYVLAEARNALLHATDFEDLEEVTEEKLQELWAASAARLRQLAQGKSRQIDNLANAVHRLSKLATFSDCTEIFTQEPKSRQSQSNVPAKILDILLRLIREHLEDASESGVILLTSATQAILYYYVWAVDHLNKKIDQGEAIYSPPQYEPFAQLLTQLIAARPRLDEARVAAVMHLLELHAVFATLRHATGADAASTRALAALARPVSAPGQDGVLATFVAAEKAFAKRAKKHLEEDPGDEEHQLTAAPDSEPESDDENEAEGDEDGENARAQRLLAENRLCAITGKIVVALVAQVLDGDGARGVGAAPTPKGRIRARISRNQARLGPNFRETLSYLSEPKPKRSHRAKAKSAEPAPARPAGHEEEMIVVEDEDGDEGEGEAEPVDEVEREERELEEMEQEDARASAEVNHGPVDGDDEDEIMGD